MLLFDHVLIWQAMPGQRSSYTICIAGYYPRRKRLLLTLVQGVKCRELEFMEFYEFNYPQHVCTVV